MLQVDTPKWVKRVKVGITHFAEVNCMEGKELAKVGIGPGGERGKNKLKAPGGAYWVSSARDLRD